MGWGLFSPRSGRMGETVSSHGNISTQSFVVWENAFSPQELDALVAYGDRQRLEKAGVSYEPGQDGAAPMRSSRTAWLPRDAESAWIHERLERVVMALNSEVYRFALIGFSDPLQYTVYQDNEGGFFDWHADQMEAPEPRKLSFSLQLSHGDSYEGCDLEIFGGSTRVPVAIPRERGTLVAFPSYVMHRVTPVRKGVRKALVFWAGGPPFR